MAKTFNPQRVGGGTFSLVRDSQGNYSLKETGFDKVVSLPMIELGQTAQTTTAQQTKTASQLTGQTAQVLTSGATTGGGGGGGAFQFTDANPYKLQEQGEDVSKRLTQSQVDSNRDFMMGMGGKTDTGAPFPGRSRITPTTPSDDTGALGLAEMDTTKTLDIKDTSEVLDEPFKGTGTMTTAQRSKLTGGTRVGPGTIKSRIAAERDTDIGTMDTVAPFPGRSRGMGGPALGISASPQTTQVADQDLEADVGTQAQLGIKKAPTAVDQLKATGTQIKKTVDSILQPGAAIKLAGQVVGGVLKAISPEPSVMDKFKTGYFKTAGDLGSSTDPGRIVGNPQTNVFAGMNRNSAFGNLGQSGQNRVDRVAGYASKNRAKAEAARKAGNLAKARKYDEKAKRQEDKARNFQRQGNKYNNDKNTALEKDRAKKDKKAQNPNLQAGADSGPGSGRDSGKSIVCTAMYQTTGLQDWSKAMKIWYIYQKKYLTLQHQEGYHKLFKPFVKGMHKSNIIKAIGAHFAKHRTQHLKHVMFNSKPSLLGKIYNKILEPICYWAGSK